MRIYNGKTSQVDMPLSNGQRITIAPRSVSGDVMPSNEFLSLLVSSYDYSEIALIVSGPFEINMCSQVSCCAGFVVNSLEEAVERFNSPKAENPEEEITNPAIVVEKTATVEKVEEIVPEMSPVEKDKKPNLQNQTKGTQKNFYAKKK